MKLTRVSKFECAQTVSKRLAEKKVAKFEKNISRRGVGPISSNKTALEPAHVVLILFAVLVVASFIFQVVRMAINGGIPAEQDS
ncbi:hypothetical protein SASPL_123867 [Salvia splendens]|uniref:Stress-associated endoplasmic reticulum protein n=1 Tax=Salvia splendens TaxID=180675 RepID=A0A8X8XPE0_SALSN|nr:hypothetical protein SASPL_123867 [Salvia splendens]